MGSKESCKIELRYAVRQLSDRCLYSASKWAAEQLVGIVEETDSSTPSSTRIHFGSSSSKRGYCTFVSASTPKEAVSGTPTPFLEEEDVDTDFYLLAKSYFDCREYRRAAHCLRDSTDKKSTFLRFYSLYLAGEKRREEETIELKGPLGRTEVPNEELISIERELSSLHRASAIDPFSLYLYGRILKQKGDERQARTILVDSINLYPWNWSAWTELQSLCPTLDTINALPITAHWMKDFFLASSYQELRMYGESLSKCENLLSSIFRGSTFLQAQVAKAQYSLRDFTKVEAIFEDLLRTDPYRVDDMDMYSNVLYSKESFAALSYLAHRVVRTDKYRPETCCIIGNYYSLRGYHEKSVVYFKRALSLNRNFLSAWTLMGHEYVEMKNIPAAVDAYRRAVDIKPSDYRAWYGLGQAYEMMGMPLYALHYFRRATFFQPGDARVWIAMAQCYETEQLDMREEAVKCYKRAVGSGDAEAIALHRLAKLHSELGRSHEAAYYYRKDLERMDGEGREGPNMVEALLFLATYCKSQRRFEEAEVYCTRLLDYTGPEKETAKNLLRGMKLVESELPSMESEHFPL